MRPAPTWAQIREADRLDRDRERRVTSHANDGVPPLLARRAVGFVMVWLLPAGPVFFAAGGGDVASRWWPALLGVYALVAALAFEDAIARRTPFEALRLEQPGALLVARFRRRAPWLLWLGACLGMLRVAQLSRAGVTDPGTLALVGVVLTVAPVHILASRVRYVAAEAIHPRRSWRWPGAVGAALAAVAGAFAYTAVLRGLFDELIFLAIFVGVRGAGVAAWYRRPLRCLLGALDFGWMAGAGAVAAGTILHDARWALPLVVAGLALLVAQSIVATPWMVLWSARQRAVVGEGVETSAKSGAATGVALGARAKLPPGFETPPLRRPPPGIGALRAGWHIRRRRVVESFTMGPWWRRAVHVLVFAPIALLWHGRAVIATVGAMIVAKEPGPVWLLLAYAAAGIAPTLSPPFGARRLYLFGVDRRGRETLHVTLFAVHGALPALVVGAGVVTWLGFAPSAAGTLVVVAALFLLRAGWGGLLKRVLARRSGAVAVAAAVVVMVVTLTAQPRPDATWTLVTAAGVAVLGSIGVWNRLVATSEGELRDALRRA